MAQTFFAPVCHSRRRSFLITPFPEQRCYPAGSSWDFNQGNVSRRWESGYFSEGRPGCCILGTAMAALKHEQGSRFGYLPQLRRLQRPRGMPPPGGFLSSNHGELTNVHIIQADRTSIDGTRACQRSPPGIGRIVEADAGAPRPAVHRADGRDQIAAQVHVQDAKRAHLRSVRSGIARHGNVPGESRGAGFESGGLRCRVFRQPDDPDRCEIRRQRRGGERRLGPGGRSAEARERAEEQPRHQSGRIRSRRNIHGRLVEHQAAR